MATAKQLDDVTECSVCKEMYTDPRLLPCGHTFCRRCIDGLSKPACPVCRKQFTLSNNGAGDLSPDYTINRLLQLKESSSGCDICSGGNDGMKVATVHCVDCQQKLCQTCQEHHKKVTATRRHKLVKLDEKPDALRHRPTTSTGTFSTRKLCYRKDYRAMRLILTAQSDNTHMVCC